MPIVQKLTLRQTIGDIPKGTQIMVVTQTKSDRSTAGILPALRKAGYTDDQFFGFIDDADNWKYRVMPEEDPGELNLTLSRFKQPLGIHPTLEDDERSILTDAKTSLGKLFWFFFIIILSICIPYLVFQFIIKFVGWVFANLVNICTLGFLCLETDWDDFFY